MKNYRQIRKNRVRNKTLIDILLAGTFGILFALACAFSFSVGVG